MNPPLIDVIICCVYIIFSHDGNTGGRGARAGGIGAKRTRSCDAKGILASKEVGER